MSANVNNKDIAIIGMSCRTAGANSPSELWDLLAKSKDVQSEITRLNSKGFYHPEGAPRKGLTNVKDAYMMDDHVIDKFDNAFFYTTPHEAVAMDPQQRMLLEVAYEALENAGIPLDDFVGTDTAVYAGMEGCDYHTILARDLNATPRYLATGTPTCMAANRLSYFFDLSGPSMSVDTACSSTMAALHQAVRTLQHGDSKLALVCGAKLILNPDMYMPSSELGFLSPSGRCKSFDAAGDGYGRGEGVLAILLKPLRAAIADGDPVRSVIKGTRLNQDGRTQGITLPSATAQSSNMECLYHELGILPKDIQYLEAHGTGTAAGDPIEFSAINSVYRPATSSCEPLIVGSVKSNIGHLEACSALASIVKATQCLERGLIPPQMHFKKPNPKIDFTRVIVPTATVSWPKTKSNVRRAAINTFGAGGTNGHAVLESHPHRTTESSRTSDRPLLFMVSAADEYSLEAMREAYAEYTERIRPDIHDLAQTLLSRRSTLRKSIFFTAKTEDEIIAKLRSPSCDIRAKTNEGGRKTLFIFTGQGAQWAQMGKALLDGSPLVRKMVLECDHALAALPDKPSWTILEELRKAKHETNVHKAEYAQPLCTALQLGLVALLESWGLKPDAVVGHSSGEIAAAYAAGFVSAREAIINAYYRGLVLSQSAGESRTTYKQGAMCAVGLGEYQAGQLLEEYAGRVQLAAINSPTSCTLSGDQDAIQGLVETCNRQGHFCRELRVDVAYHSRHMSPAAEEYRKALEQVNVCSQALGKKCEMFSSVTGLILDPRDCTPGYWSRNMTSTVKFFAAIETGLANFPEVTVAVELGPHPALKGPVSEITRSLSKNNLEYFNTCSRGTDDFEALLDNVGKMVTQGIPLKLRNVNAHEMVDSHCTYEQGNVLTDLPGYQWNHRTSFWTESRVSRKVRFREHPRHQLLGSRYVDDIPRRPCWRNHLMMKEIPWLAQFKHEGMTAMPPAAFILMVLEAARQMYDVPEGTGSIQLSKVQFKKQLPLDEFARPDASVEIQLIATSDEDSEKFGFEILSCSSTYDSDEHSWMLHCSGCFAKVAQPPRDPNRLTSDRIQSTSLRNAYATTEAVESAILNVIKTCSRGTSGSFSIDPYPYEHYPIDPRALNAILSLPPCSLTGTNLPATYRMHSIESLTVQSFGKPSGRGDFAVKVHSRLPYGLNTSIDIELQENWMHLAGVLHQAERLNLRRLELRSLFFKPISKPDLTSHFCDIGDGISLLQCVELLSYKWPMADVKLMDIKAESTISTILEAFWVKSEDRRPSVRSIYLDKPYPGPVFDRVKYVDYMDEEPRYHIIFCDETSNAKTVADQLLPAGLACFPSEPRISLPIDLSSTFERVCDVSNLGCEPWQLWRKKSNCAVLSSSLKTILFGCTPSDAVNHMPPVAESITLEPGVIADFCHSPQRTRFQAIVIDNPDQSIITSWKGDVLLLWLRMLLKSAESILWVTMNGTSSPFQQVAGMLLRTLQAEQPSLKVCWAVLTRKNSEFYHGALFGQYLRMAQSSMSGGQNECKIVFSNSNFARLVRYYPDDELSSATGVIEPSKIISPTTYTDHELSFAAPREPVVLSKTLALFQHRSVHEVEVDVEASVVGLAEILMYEGHIKPITVSTQPQYFAGTVRDDLQGRFASGTKVVGWSSTPHQNRVQIPHSVLFHREEKQPATEAASEFAALAVATYIVDGYTRARHEDTFGIRVHGVLKSALHQLCKSVGAVMIDPQSNRKADFIVTYNVPEGLQINGLSLDIFSYLESERGQVRISANWKSKRPLSCPLKSFNIAEYPRALGGDNNLRDEPYSTAIDRAPNGENIEHVPIYEPQTTLFSATANYVIIGGLGGLGRFICNWMVEHGAKHLNVISRSGPASPDAQSFHSSITATEAKVQVFKADACDRSAIHSILATIRSKGQIKGIINLAMILGDAPMASMTGEEWDRALRVKIDSSWILHQETLEDELDHFILFSSIASVCGNRNQGNYNVANTFLNALAEYRQEMDKPGISIALGAMTDMGILYNLSKPDLLDILTRSGLSHLTQKELAKIMEAAILISPRRDHPLILTGLEMFERDANNKLIGRNEPLFWAELPEFSHLQTYRSPDCDEKERQKATSLQEQIRKLHDVKDDAGMKGVVMDAFLDFLAKLTGFEKGTIDPGKSLGMYGVDSLSGVSTQYWFHRELGTDISVGVILGGNTIEQIVAIASEKLEAKQKAP